jgi:hypothetical protein
VTITVRARPLTRDRERSAKRRSVRIVMAGRSS